MGRFAKHRDIFKGNIGTCLKRQFYNSCALPAMTYGAETWALTSQAKNKLAAAQKQWKDVKHHIPGQTNKHLGKDKGHSHEVTDNSEGGNGPGLGQGYEITDRHRITTWEPYERKRPRRRLARRRRDELDDYWKGTI